MSHHRPVTNIYLSIKGAFRFYIGGNPDDIIILGELTFLITKSILQTRVGFERSGDLGGRTGLMKDAFVFHYGKCRSFPHTVLGTKISIFRPLLP